MKIKNITIIFCVLALLLFATSCGKQIDSNITDSNTNSHFEHNYSSNIFNDNITTSNDSFVSTAFVSSSLSSIGSFVENSSRTTKPPVTQSSSSSKNTSSRAGSSGNMHTSNVSSQTSSNNNSTVTAADSDWIANRVLELINADRKAMGRGTLSTASKAHEMATVRAKELTQKFEHYRPDGKTWNNIYNEYKYGKCTDCSNIIPPNEWKDYENIDGEGKSYSVGGGENITMGTEYLQNSATFDGITYSCRDKELYARAIHFNFKNSSAHWTDISKADYKGIGIGVKLNINESRIDYYCAILTMEKTFG